SLRRLLHHGAGEANLLDVAMVGAAAAAQYGKARKLAPQAGIKPSQLGRIAGVEVFRLVEFGMAARRRIGADAAQPPGPRIAGCERILEVPRMRAIDHVISR